MDYVLPFNLHPAEGVRSYEEQYEAVARDNGVDPATKQEIPWISSKKSFIKVCSRMF